MHDRGEQTEKKSVKQLEDAFGEGNVLKVGELGKKIDALSGIDVEIKTDEGIKTAQVKPFSGYEIEGGKITMLNTGVTKPYKTDLMVFYNDKEGVFYFDNSNTEINEKGQYVFDVNDLRKS